jgi:hypothetical protein
MSQMLPDESDKKGANNRYDENLESELEGGDLQLLAEETRLPFFRHVSLISFYSGQELAEHLECCGLVVLAAEALEELADVGPLVKLSWTHRHQQKERGDSEACAGDPPERVERGVRGYEHAESGSVCSQDTKRFDIERVGVAELHLEPCLGLPDCEIDD